MNRLPIFIQLLLFVPGSTLTTLSQPAPLPLADSPVFPNPAWQSVNPASQGWNSGQLDGLSRFIRDSAQTTGMLIIHRGRVVFRYGNVEELSYIASCRKSVVAMLFGPFVQRGQINLDKTIGQLDLYDVGGLLPIEKQATIRHLLTARSGVYHPASNAGDASAMAPPRGSVQPGRYWLYNNWDFNAAGSILEKETGRNLYDLVDSLLARPLRMQDWQRSSQQKHGDSTRSRYLAYHMWFSTRDMARLGYLMLNGGNWQGRQVLPASWVNSITTVVTPYQEALANKTNYHDFGYGYLWWIWDAPSIQAKLKGAYTASGAFGQFITVIPRMNVVIAHKTKSDDYRKNTPTDTYLRIVNRIVAAFKGP